MVIAGSGREAGKTAVGCALVAALPELCWMAVKVTPHLHDVGDGSWEEFDRDSDKDTGRYLAAGALRAFLISDVDDSDLVRRVGECRERDPECDALMVESNRSLLGVVRRDERTVSLAVLAGEEAGWKESVRARVIDADALVLTAGASLAGIGPRALQRQVFQLTEGEWSSPELVDFIRERLLV